MKKLLLICVTVSYLALAETRSISQLPSLSASNVSSTDVFPVVSSYVGDTAKFKVQDLNGVSLLQLVGDTGSGGTAGFCPAPPSGSAAAGKFLKANATWAIPPTMVGDSGSGGTAGYVPAPGSGTAAAGDFLKADGTWAVPAAMPTGSVAMFAGSSAPSGWLMCDGSAVSRTIYSALFGVIGTTYGSGNGTTTFNLPNTQGIFVRGVGSQTVGGISYSGTLGTTQGDQLQGHYHGTSSLYPARNGGGAQFTGGSLYSESQQVVVTGPTSDGTNGTPRTGAETRPANLALNYIIKN